MTTKPHKSILRLPRKHRGAADKADQVDVRRLLEQQSLRDAVVGGIIVIILFSVLWAMLSTLVNRIFPWMTVVLGALIGLVMVLQALVWIEFTGEIDIVAELLVSTHPLAALQNQVAFVQARQRLPVDLLPAINYPNLTVITNYADTPADDLVRLVTEPLEEP